MHETIAARLKRLRAELGVVPSSDGHRTSVSTLTDHIRKVREAKRKAQLEQQRNGKVDGTDEGNRQ